MTVARHYVMIAAPEKCGALETALRALADAVRPLAGCEGVELMHDLGDEHRFIFIEKWASVDAHKQAGSSLPKATFGLVMAALAGPPQGAYLDYLTVM